MLSRWFFSAFVSMVFSYSAHGQNAFQVWADAGAFKYDQDRSYVEMWYAFPRGALEYQKTDGIFRASVLMTAIVKANRNESEPLSRIWRVPVEVSDTTGISSRLLIGKIQFTLEPGRYTVSLYSRDEAVAMRSDTVEFAMEVRDFAKRAVRFSDIELCSSIAKSTGDTSSLFYKNTLEAVPNPPLMFGATLPVVHHYAELYNADADAYLMRAEIVSSFGSTVASRTQKKFGKHPSRVEVGATSVATLPTGVYTLILSYGDTTGTMRLSQSKRFYVYNPSVAPDTSGMRQVASSIAYEFASLAEDELDTQFASASYISTGDERSLWNSLSGAEAKRKFLTGFWNNRDTDPATQVNEAFVEYMTRLQYSNEHFRTSYRPGWKTDRGRVYVSYGPPDFVQRNQVESDAKPYETWTYDNIQGGVEFIFVDKGGFNELELVHSTMRNEVNNPSWQSHIRTR